MLEVLKITKVSHFAGDIYRIELEDGLILDVFEEIIPKINDIFNYEFLESINYEDIKNSRYTIMSGVYTDNPNIISFGGLLCYINKNNEINNKKVFLKYFIT